MWHAEPHAMDVLSPIQYVSWVHGQGLTSLGCNQYTVMSSIQLTEYPSCGTRFWENRKTTMSLLGWWMLCCEEPQTICICSYSFHISYGSLDKTYHVCDTTNTRWWHQSKPQITRAVGCGTRPGSTDAKPPCHPQSGEWCVMKNLKLWIYYCHPFHMFCGNLDNAWYW